MTNQTMLCMRARLVHMEKSIVAKCRNQSWFVLASFCFWFLVLYFYYVGLIGGKNGVTLLASNNYVNSVDSRESNYSLHISGSSSETTSLLPVTGHRSSGEIGDFTDSVEQKNVTKNEEELVYAVPYMENQVEQVLNPIPIVENSTEQVTKQLTREIRVEIKPDLDSCSGRYIYVHNLPSRFNEDLLENCWSLNKWIDMCPYIVNMGLGPQVLNSEKVFSSNGWFETNQFLLGVIFHNRMKQYKCLTNDSSMASAIYVPFYAGLEVSRYLWGFNTSVRDSASLDLVKWLAGKPEWKSMWGRDHFLVAGRISWDFRRLTDNESDWGNKLMFLPESKNMTMLLIESSPWNNNDFAIPYPTYFHPSSDTEVFQWQNIMRRRKRPFLFSFAGAPRPNHQDSIRGEIIDQCRASSGKCKLLDCNSSSSKCNNPVDVMNMFQNSIFCLQPPGDSSTRRSTFDSISAGCIPVFFDPGSAYVQYLWHLPKNYTKYSVFIPMNDVKDANVSIEKTLLRIPKDEVVAMREEVIRLIPRIVYAHPMSRLETHEDAFDIAVKGVLERVETVRREIEGRNSSFDFAEEYSW